MKPIVYFVHFIICVYTFCKVLAPLCTYLFELRTYISRIGVLGCIYIYIIYDTKSIVTQQYRKDVYNHAVLYDRFFMCVNRHYFTVNFSISLKMFKVLFYLFFFSYFLATFIVILLYMYLRYL